MNRTKVIYFLSAFVLIIGCYALNLSYSLFTQTVKPEGNVVEAVVPYVEASLETSTYSIPANSSKIIKLRVINSGTADIRYGISVEDTKGTTIRLVDGFAIVGKLPASTTENPSSKEVWVYVTNSTDTEVSDLTFKITSNYITINFYENSFISTSNIDCENTMKLLNGAIIARANNITEEESKTLGYAMYSETLRTTPAEEISESDESLLLTTEDDYTAITGQNSYYFRGNVKDNYVNFAGMCWRVVRIEGDDSVKLILEDQDTKCEDMCTDPDTCGENLDGNFDVGQGNFGYIKKPITVLKDGVEKNTYSYIPSYLHGDTYFDISMASSFKAYQEILNSKINTIYPDNGITDMLNIRNWCMNDNAYLNESEDLTTAIPLSDLDKQNKYEMKDENNTMYFDSYIRLYGNNPKQPTLKCTGNIMNHFDDEFLTDMYIATLTADEYVMAGSKIKNSNSKFYLINNYQNTNHYFSFTLSLSRYGEEYYVTKAFALNYFGEIDEYNIYYSDYLLRPAISLKSDIKISNGTGLQTDPYVIAQ